MYAGQISGGPEKQAIRTTVGVETPITASLECRDGSRFILYEAGHMRLLGG